jgi:tRNA threonylcarbamoyladenosine biosynthesis protein TsaE
MHDLGFEESFGGTGLCLVEWADRIKDLLPPRRYEVSFALGADESDRTITIEKFPGGNA